jgi:hypothetical protein
MPKARPRGPHLPQIIVDAGRRCFDVHPDITGARLFAEFRRLTAEAGWEFGARPHRVLACSAGVLVHEAIERQRQGSIAVG